MLSRLLRPSCRQTPMMLLAVKAPLKINVRKFMGLVPPNQYDVPIPNRLKLMHVLREYWETIPLFVTTGIAFGALFYAIIFSLLNKVEVVYKTRSRGNISRTMDLRNPTVHKMRTITQRCEPWPEMADALEKVNAAEKRALTRLSCNAS